MQFLCAISLEAQNSSNEIIKKLLDSELINISGCTSWKLIVKNHHSKDELLQAGKIFREKAAMENTNSVEYLDNIQTADLLEKRSEYETNSYTCNLNILNPDILSLSRENDNGCDSYHIIKDLNGFVYNIQNNNGIKNISIYSELSENDKAYFANFPLFLINDFISLGANEKILSDSCVQLTVGSKSLSIFIENNKIKNIDYYVYNTKIKTIAINGCDYTLYAYDGSGNIMQQAVATKISSNRKDTLNLTRGLFIFPAGYHVQCDLPLLKNTNFSSGAVFGKHLNSDFTFAN